MRTQAAIATIAGLVALVGCSGANTADGFAHKACVTYLPDALKGDDGKLDPNLLTFDAGFQARIEKATDQAANAAARSQTWRPLYDDLNHLRSRLTLTQLVGDPTQVTPEQKAEVVAIMGNIAESCAVAG